jgi:surface antigen
MTAIPMQTQRRSKTRTAVAVAMIATLGVSLCACETIQRETGFSRSTQTGAVAGAAFGGIVAALANANPAWIAASVILGGVAGGAIGNHMGREDAERHARANLGALDTLGQGQTESWSNSRTGNRGSTTVTRVVSRDSGQVCKSYRETIRTSAETVTKEGTACRYPGGTWQLV